jgi:hypothetical protein
VASTTVGSMPRKDLTLIAVAALWVLGVGAGFRAILVYAYTPGPQPASNASSVWPARTAILPTKGHACLLVFVHPQCPCSQATIEELAAVLAHKPNQVDAYVLFFAPRSASQDWVKSKLWRETSAIGGVHVVEDVGGTEARLFGAATSGQSFLYASSGRLLFRGGITAARGHAGANAGSDAILRLLEGLTSQHRTTPVFGCNLRSGSGS